MDGGPKAIRRPLSPAALNVACERPRIPSVANAQATPSITKKPPYWARTSFKPPARTVARSRAAAKRCGCDMATAPVPRKKSAATAR